ncbi:MAG: glutamine-hydrolyzing carbamoyl-phosphate synthase small subunit [Spirochaetota bacterium]
MRETCILVLADGTQFTGRSFGHPAPTVAEIALDATAPKAIGEVVFNTAMSGYHEVLTDPSYTGQLVAMTYPHIGNYGCDPDWSELGPGQADAGKPARSGIEPAGFIVRSLYEGPVPDGRQTLDEFLHDNATPGITGIDTRALTLRLRDGGSSNGVIVRPSSGDALTEPELARVKAALAAFPDMEGRDLIGEVGSRETIVVNESGSPHIALLDCGSKANIVRQLTGLGCRVTIVPSTADDELVEGVGADALFISNGPGDPAVLERQVELIRESIGKRPVLGICLGHQLIAEALGAKTYKMKFGHHGVNHPVRDERTKRVFVTSQNHGFAVDEQTLPEGCEVWFRNANDQSVEGLILDDLKVRTTQFHPESAPGPNDSHWIFGAFLENLR